MDHLVVVYPSAYSQMDRISQAVSEGAGAELVAVNDQVTLSDDGREALSSARAIILGMPSVRTELVVQFGGFVLKSMHDLHTRSSEEKLFAGFTVCHDVNGQSRLALECMSRLTRHHGGSWIGGCILRTKYEDQDCYAPVRSDRTNRNSVQLHCDSLADDSYCAIESAYGFGELVAAIVGRLPVRGILSP